MRALHAVTALGALLAFACGTEPGAPNMTMPAGSALTSPIDRNQPGAVTPSATCSEAAKLVYVVSSQNTLYSFHPGQLRFTPIGQLNCPATPGNTPFSMAVDRSGTAWVNYTDGHLFKVSTKDASCTPTAYVATDAFRTFGMGFATDAPGSTSESLYICGYDFSRSLQGRGLARLDLQTLQPGFIGDFPYPLTQNCAELTGTGDARLYGFFQGAPASLVGIDKQHAQISQPRPLPGVQTSNESSYAFSHWGGDFWFYSSIGKEPSHVTRLRASSDGAVETVIPNVGFNIVGAGVSTCAPTAPIK